jgi:hypothetical protein
MRRHRAAQPVRWTGARVRRSPRCPSQTPAPRESAHHMLHSRSNVSVPWTASYAISAALQPKGRDDSIPAAHRAPSAGVVEPHMFGEIVSHQLANELGRLPVGKPSLGDLGLPCVSEARSGGAEARVIRSRLSTLCTDSRSDLLVPEILAGPVPEILASP